MKHHLMTGNANLPGDWSISAEGWRHIETASGHSFSQDLRAQVEACVRRLANAQPPPPDVNPAARFSSTTADTKDIRDQVDHGLGCVDAIMRFLDGTPGEGISKDAASWVRLKLREPSYQGMLLAALQPPDSKSEPSSISLEVARGILLGLRERLLEISRDLPERGRPSRWELHRFIRDLAAIFEAAGGTATRSRLPDKHRPPGPFHRFLRSVYETVPEKLRPGSAEGDAVSSDSLLTHHLGEAFKHLA